MSYLETQLTYLMNYIQLPDKHCIHHYGLIRNIEDRNVLLAYSKEQKLTSFPVATDKAIITVLNIQGEFAYIRGKYPHGIQEYNNTLRMLNNNRTARWRFKEIEYKFNILNKMEDFFLQFNSLQLPGFAVTHFPQYFNSVETMFYPYQESYFSLLRWENEDDYNAIKIKKTLSTQPILIRDSIIIDYTPQQLSHVLHLFRINNDNWIQHNTTFYKRKKRHIAIDCELGYVFGISCNISQVNSHYFCQVELEYWSKILPCQPPAEDISHIDSKEQIESHLRLIESMNKYLSKSNIQFDNIQLTKNAWLQHLATSQKK